MFIPIMPNASHNPHKALDVQHLPEDVEHLMKVAVDTGQKLVLATGVFDIFHDEHRTFLVKAKAVGDILIVGVESDLRARALKGEGRPVNTEEVRRHQIEATGIADVAFILPEAFSSPEQYQGLVHHLRPAILAVSSHTDFLDRKAALLAEVGGEVKVVHEHNPRVSTSILLQQERMT
jgi:cytidyltransferase-like protein